MLKNIDTVEEFWNPESFLSIAGNIPKLDPEDFNSLEYFKDNFLPNSYKYFFLSSGRNGFKLILKNLKKNGKNIHLPAFNCSIMEDIIKEAGFNPIPYDFFKIPGKYNWEELISSLSIQTAAVVVTHHFGIPVNFLNLKKQCNLLSIPIIEDSAHCLDGYVKGQIAGSIADASIFSFNYDKPISLGWGGIASFNNLSNNLMTFLLRMASLAFSNVGRTN